MRPNKVRAQYIDKIRVEYGELLSDKDCDSILFFMRPNLEWGGNLNRAVLQMAGNALDEYIVDRVHSPRSGEVFALPPFDTRYKVIIMAILADWDGGVGFEERDLLNCYRRTIEIAEAAGARRIAIPAMGRDKRDFPHIRFARLALQGITDRLDCDIDYLKIMCADRTMMTTYSEQLEKIRRGHA